MKELCWLDHYLCCFLDYFCTYLGVQVTQKLTVKLLVSWRGSTIGCIWKGDPAEATLQRCSWVEVFWKCAANLQENTHMPMCDFNKVAKQLRTPKNTSRGFWLCLISMEQLFPVSIGAVALVIFKKQKQQREVFCKKRCSKKFRKIQNTKEFLAQMFSGQFCETSKNTFFIAHLRTTAS